MIDVKDYDETRRCLYMALAARQGVKRYELAGTIANALAHHRHTYAPAQALAFAKDLIENGPGADEAAWALIEDITRELDQEESAE